MGITAVTDMIETSKDAKMVESTVITAPQPTTEAFHLNTPTGDINPSSTEGGKLCMKAAEGLPEGQKIYASL